MKPSRKLPWRKLASDPSAEWQQLPLLTRGVAVELMRRLDPDDGLDCSVGVEPRAAICMVVGAHSRERRRVNEAIDELVLGRWLVLSGRRWLAFFPDLDRTRPSAEQAATMQRDGGGAATALHRGDPQNEATARKDAKHDHREEEKRGEKEEKRGEESGRSLTRVVSVAAHRVTAPTDDELARRAVVAAFEAHTLSPPDAEQLAIGRWCRRQAELDRCDVGGVAALLAEGFLRSAKAKAAGYPLTFLQRNPLEFWTSVPSSNVGTFGSTPVEVLAEMGDR